MFDADIEIESMKSLRERKINFVLFYCDISYYDIHGTKVDDCIDTDALYIPRKGIPFDE